MTPYSINEGRFLVPDAWKDQSLTLFSSPADAPAEFSFVVSREAVPPGTASSAYARRQMAQLPGSLPGFELLRESSALVDSLPALEAEFLWQSDKGRMHQWQVYVVRNGVALTLTATAPQEALTRHRPDVRRLLDTFKFS